MADNLKKLLSFSNGALSQADPPAWYVEAVVAESIDFAQSLKSVGARELEKYGEHGNTITVYRTPTGHFVEFMDFSEETASVFIDNPADYLAFRKDWILPLAQLDRLFESHIDTGEGR